MVSSTLIRGTVTALAAALVVASGTAIGLDAPWPLLLLIGVALAPRLTPGTVGAVLLGAAAWWGAMGLRAGLLRDTTSGEIVATVTAVAIVTVAAAASRERLPSWAALVGIGAFAGVYEPLFAAEPTLFASESPLAFASVVVATSIGALAGVLSNWLDALLRQERAGLAGGRHVEVAS